MPALVPLYPAKPLPARIRLLAAFLTMAILGVHGCGSLPENNRRMHSVAISGSEGTALGLAVGKKTAAHPGKSGFVALQSGLDAFVARAVLAHVAERTLDVQYYLYHSDLVGRLLTYKLLEAADRGVRVRLLLDDMDMGGREANLAALDAHPNIQIRLFNPFNRGASRSPQFLTRFGDVTRRMHNKSFTADNQATIVGGRNIGNEYFEADPDLAFGDLDVLAIGPVVKEVSGAFDKYWNNELAYPVSLLVEEGAPYVSVDDARDYLEAFFQEQRDGDYLTALGGSDLAKKLEVKGVNYSFGVAEALYDEPEKLAQAPEARETHLAPRLAPYIDGLTDEFIIFSAYFVPGREGVKFLRGLRERGIRVRILTNSLASTDVAIVHAGYGKYRLDLLRAGVELYEVNQRILKDKTVKSRGLAGSSKASLHAKAFIFDREELFIGSLNLDPRSTHQNTEIGIAFNSPEMAGEMARGFDEKIDEVAFRLELHTLNDGRETIRWIDASQGEERTFKTDPYTSFWKRFWVVLAGALPIESQL
jgi:putative cardiolipin synthase